MDDLPVIKCSYSEFKSFGFKNLHGIYVTERGTFYFVNNKRHRTDGPAEEYSTGYNYWFNNNQLHRLDGPAVESASGYKAWYINDKKYYSKEDYETAAYLYKNNLENYI